MKIQHQNIAGWLLLHIGRPLTQNKFAALSSIICSMIIIGLSDYATGIHVSLVLFYFIPITLAVIRFGWRSAVVVAIACVLLRVIGDLVANEGNELPSWYLWNALTTMTVFLLLIWILDAFVSLHRQLEQRVQDRTAALVEAARTRRQLEEELLAVGSRERNLIGHELHDEICQHLVGTAMAAQVLAQCLAKNDSALAADAETIVGLLEEGADKTRKLAHGLLLSEISPEKLSEKLSEIADQANGSGIVCRLRHEGNTRVSDADTAAHLFRIAHEATRNALKHAAPRHIDISLVGTDSAIVLMVVDDGVGMLTDPLNANRENAGMGMRIMSNRAAFIGAQLIVTPAAAGGTQIICHLPRSQDAR